MSGDRVPAVSVVLPAFNRAGTIRAAVESVLRQTFADFELIVVDDGSTDGTLAALDGIADPRLRRIAHPRNLGVSAARNSGLREARATWVAFQDSDDEWLPRKLEKQMACLAEADTACVACYCGMLWVNRPLGAAPGRVRPLYVPAPSLVAVAGDVLPTLLQASLASTQTLVVRRTVLEEIGGFDESLPALVDWDCALRLAARGPFAFVDEPLVLQFLSDNSITRFRDRRLRARSMIVRKHAALFAARPDLLALQYRGIAADARRLGEIATARAAIGEACRLRPFDLRLRAIAVYLALMALRRRGGGPAGG
jgi:glycosyltransferase involved in cell wall biosynthesis